MHELGIMTGVMESVENVARDAGAERVLKVSLQVGVMTEAMRKDKRYTADGKVWKLYSYWWMKLNPARRWLLALFRRI